MKQKRKENKMDNPNTQPRHTYGQSQYSPQKPSIEVVTSDENLMNFRFVEDINYQPTLLLLESIVKAQKDREAGKASPIFSSVSEMKKWFDEQDE